MCWSHSYPTWDACGPWCGLYLGHLFIGSNPWLTYCAAFGLIENSTSHWGVKDSHLMARMSKRNEEKRR